MPNRILKESVCTSDDIDSLSWFEEVFFYRLIVNCDDYGRMDARPAILRARLFPLKNVTVDNIAKTVEILRAAGLIDLYTVDGRSILQLRTWERHQQIRAQKSKYPGMDKADKGNIYTSDSTCNQMKSDEINCNQMKSDVTVIQSNPNPNPNPKEGERARAKRFAPPTVDDVRQYAAEQGYTMDADRFVDFYASKGWMVGKNPMRDWKAAVRNWAQRERAAPAQAASRPVKVVEQQKYEQREYVHTDDTLNAMMAEWKHSGGIS